MIWEEKPSGPHPIWELNCLFYAEAAAAVELVTEVGGQLESGVELDPEELDPEDLEEDDAVTDPGSTLTQMEPSVGEGVVTEPTGKLLERLRQLRKVIGWIECEIKRREVGGKRSPRERRRARARCRMLQRRFGRKVTTLTRQTREKQKGLLRVRTLQLKEARKRERIRPAETGVARDGPGSLGTGKAGRVEVTEEQAEEVGKFWRGVWGQTGSYHPEYTALKLWTAKVRKDRKD